MENSPLLGNHVSTSDPRAIPEFVMSKIKSFRSEHWFEAMSVFHIFAQSKLIDLEWILADDEPRGYFSSQFSPIRSSKIARSRKSLVATRFRICALSCEDGVNDVPAMETPTGLAGELQSGTRSCVRLFCMKTGIAIRSGYFGFVTFGID
jgi:hypothetical protein